MLILVDDCPNETLKAKLLETAARFSSEHLAWQICTECDTVHHPTHLQCIVCYESPILERLGEGTPVDVMTGDPIGFTRRGIFE